MIKTIAIALTLSVSMVSVAHAQQKNQGENTGKKRAQSNVERSQRISRENSQTHLPKTFKFNDTTVTVSGGIRAETTHKARR